MNSGRFLLYCGPRITPEGGIPLTNRRIRFQTILSGNPMIADPTPCCPVNTERQYSVLTSRAAGAWADGLALPTTNCSRVYRLAAKEPSEPPIALRFWLWEPR